MESELKMRKNNKSFIRFRSDVICESDAVFILFRVLRSTLIGRSDFTHANSSSSLKRRQRDNQSWVILQNLNFYQIQESKFYQIQESSSNESLSIISENNSIIFDDFKINRK